MRFLIENFGPVKEADILIKPLTIFVGPNASGKSYISYLLWCLLTTKPDIDALVKMVPGKKVSAEKLNTAAKKFLLKVLEAPSPLYKDLENHLKNTFRVDDIRVFIRSEAQKCKFEICSDDTERRIKFDITPKGLNFVTEGLSETLQKNLAFKTRRLHDRTFLEMFWKGEKLHKLEIVPGNQTPIIGFIPYTLMHLLDGYWSGASGMSSIAPDGRAGFMRIRETIISQVLTPPITPPKQEQVIPMMSAVDLAFIRDSETYRSVQDEEVSKLTNFIEELLNIKFELRRAPPRYIVRIKGLEIPLQSAPSGYRELAPLAFAFRYGIWTSMFIEEPEAHLHPDAQAIVTRAIAEASKRDVDIIVTTHSIDVLDELSNLLRLNKLSKKKREELGYKKWEGLSPKDVAIYCFSKEGDVEPVEVSEDGLSETGLDRIHSEMANRHAAVERSFKKGKKGKS